MVGIRAQLRLTRGTNSLYATNTHPLAYTHGLDVFDAQDNLVKSLPQVSHTTALAVNPATHHLFLAHANTYEPYAVAAPAQDDTVEILDNVTLGHVTTLHVADEPWRMTLAGDKIYVADYRNGKITIIGDIQTDEPVCTHSHPHAYLVSDAYANPGGSHSRRGRRNCDWLPRCRLCECGSRGLAVLSRKTGNIQRSESGLRDRGRNRVRVFCISTAGTRIPD